MDDGRRGIERESVTPVGYQEASREYRQHADEALKDGDFGQASEKLGGAAAELVKAVAESRGWEHNGHSQLFGAVRCLAEETGDQELSDLFRSAGFLHTNFYEPWLPGEDVERAAGEVHRLLQKVEGLLEVSV